MRDVDMLFEPGSARLAHIHKVVANARNLEKQESFNGMLIAAAIYHDIGYSTQLVDTGFHPIDGAQTALRDLLPKQVVDAVLFHTGAQGECQRARPDLLRHYPHGCGMMGTRLSRALTYCDLHAGPKGQFMLLEERLSDIRDRHATNEPLLDNIAFYEQRFQDIDYEFAHVFWNLQHGS